MATDHEQDTNHDQAALDPTHLSVEELERQVRLHNRLYWIDNAPQISDPEFDQLVEALRTRAPDSPVLDAIGPQGADVEGSDVLSGDRAKIRHDQPMLSLDKCYDEATLLKWFEKFEGEAIVSPKVDGVAASIKYDDDGQLYLAATRGTGTVGEEITENARRIVDLPKRVDPARAGGVPFEVRGEAYIPLSVFHREFAEDYANPRNLTAGGLKQKDPEQTARYQVHFFAYDLVGGPTFDTEWEKIEHLKGLGFQVVDSDRVPHEDLQTSFERWAADRNDLDYETDGVVYKADRCEEQERLGHTSHHPRYAIAYKFQGESGVSTLREIHWSVSRTGAINPVGIVDPVVLSGATVTRVSLHNLAIMEALGGEGGLKLGSKVLMMRRGGVIPNMEKVVEPGDELVAIPDACPECGAETFREGDVLCADHRENCRRARIQQLDHFTVCIGIKGFGQKMLEKLYDEELVSEPADFFTLTAEQLVPLERVGDRLADRLLGEIEARREVPAELFLRSLGIDELGRFVSKLLARHCQSMDDIFALTPEELAEIHGIGDVIARTVCAGLTARRAMIESLLEHVRPVFPDPETLRAEEERAAQGALAGKRFLFTGTLESMTRKEAQQRVKELGGETPSAVSRELDYLVIGDKDYERYEGGWRSSKLKKALGYNDEGHEIAIINESRFLALLEGEADDEAQGPGTEDDA